MFITHNIRRKVVWWKTDNELEEARSEILNARFFDVGELKSKCGRNGLPQPEATRALDQLRHLMRCQLRITSAYRSVEHNKNVGGKRNSYHIQGLAFDISTVGWTDMKIHKMLLIAGSLGFKGMKVYKSFVHLDMRNKFGFW